MTSIAATNNAALAILQQVYMRPDQEDGKDSRPIDAITAIINKVPGGDSPVKTQAESRITSGMLDVQQAKGVASDALKFLESGGFKSSDPTVKDTLKRLINDNPGGFAELVKAEKARGDGISGDNAIANAMVKFIEQNREHFGAEEFVIGFRFANGGSNIVNIADVNGNSTRGALSDRLVEDHAEFSAVMREVLDAAKDLTKPAKFDDSRLKDISSKVREGLNALTDWYEQWRKAFGF